MAEMSEWIPMHWPSGPLEIARRKKKEGFNREARETLERWHTPAALEFLKGTPVNCLVVGWAEGAAEDREQQRTLAPLIQAGKRAGLSFVGWVADQADQAAAIASAEAAGLSAVAVPGDGAASEFPVLSWVDRSEVRRKTASAVLPITGNVWPGLANSRTSGSAATTGATGLPWLDSNAWYVRLVRRLTENQTIWLLFDPPGAEDVVRPESYVMAVCDVAAAGGSWVVSLDDHLRARLADGHADAVDSWRGVGQALDFFARRKRWRSFRWVGTVGVVADFVGPNRFLAEETLNLLTRLNMHTRIFQTPRAADHPFTGLRAIVYLDPHPPEGELRQKLNRFVEEGNLLLAGPEWPDAGSPVPGDPYERFQVHTVGSGRLAVAKEELVDPYLVAADTRLLLGRRSDVVRLFNAGTSIVLYSAAPGGGTDLLQALNHTSRVPTSALTVWFRRKYARARLWTLDNRESTPLKMAAAADGIEVFLPPISTYAAVELES